MSTFTRREWMIGSAGVPLLAAAGAALEVRSPDDAVRAELDLDRAGVLRYRASHRGVEVIAPSRLGFQLDDATMVAEKWRITKTRRAEHRGSWEPVYGERAVVPDNYRELVMDIATGSTAVPQLQVVLRAYNEGIALRYRFPAGAPFTIRSEFTEFALAPSTFAFEEHGTEGEYLRSAAAAIKPDCERPLTVVHPSGAYASIVEAALDRYPRMLLSPSKLTPGALSATLSGPAKIAPPFETPWRAVVLGSRPGDLLERNYLVLNLNAPAEIADTSWIRPGKAIRETTLSTTGGKACVDFAVAHGLQYIEYDAGWYGHEYDDAADATTVAPDPKRIAGIPNYGGLDLHQVIAYAREHGIGVLLYVNRRALERQIETIFPLYQKWGVAGVKFGFVNVGPQEWTTWLMEAVRKAARHKLVVDIHDGYRPTGFSRTWPNLLTQEGIRGNEHMPTARHNVTLPFTRLVAGAGDYTVCYYTDRIKTTHAHQLAISAAFYSPLQFLFWYDQPKAYNGEPEVEFFRHVPTVWDDTRVIGGEIGEYVTIARRKGREWFLASLTNEQARTLDVPLSFLESGTRYRAHIYRDDASVSTRTKVGIERFAVDSKSVLPARLTGSGGQAVRIVPER